jgi:hypothetical protein
MAYTTIDDPSAHFQIALYTGNGSDDLSVTFGGNSDLQPDLLWFKNRNDTQGHEIFDSTRGVAESVRPHNNEVANTDSPNDRLMSFDSDGFELDDDGNPNTDTNTYVAWGWKANGGSRTTNAEDGHNPGGGYQANTTAGFSIVDYTGVYTSAPGTMAHGLGAVPHMMAIKNREIAGSWIIYHHKNTSAPETDILDWSHGGATYDNVSYWNDTAPTSTVFTINTSNDVNKDGDGIIAYCWTSIQGYSKFGGYTGNGDADGAFVYLGFRPAFIIIKCNSDASTDWVMYSHNIDVNPIGSASGTLYPSITDAASSAGGIDFLSNGFKARSTNGYNNGDARTYIYMAFAEQPFVTSGGVPCTAR